MPLRAVLLTQVAMAVQRPLQRAIDLEFHAAAEAASSRTRGGRRFPTRSPGKKIQSHSDRAGGERHGHEHDGNPESSAQNGTTIQTAAETAGICNQTGHRCAECQASLLDSGEGCGSNV